MNDKTAKQRNTKSRKPIESIAGEQPHYRLITNFKKAIGKTVESIKHQRDEPEGVWTLEVWFTDGTMFLFDIDARPRIRANFQKKVRPLGDLKSIRRYGKKTICDW